MEHNDIEIKSKLKKYVCYHLAINNIHGIMHVLNKVNLNIYQFLFVAIDIMILPLIGLNTFNKNRIIGNLICLLSIFGSGIFGTYFHFILISPDHISQVPLTNIWGYLFHITAYLISIIDSICVYKIYNIQYLDKYKNN
jgi:hypothetical protein